MMMALCLAASNVFAQPFTPSMSSDTYGIAQGGGNILSVPTPKDNNDNPIGKQLDINDAVNLLLGTAYSRNSDVDSLQWTAGDATWKDIAGYIGNTGTYILVGLTAANSNTLQVYDVGAPGSPVDVLGPVSGFDFFGDGSSGDPFFAGFSPFTAPGTDFGWRLKSVKGLSTTIWDSQALLNANGLDHMLTYHLASLAGTTVYIKYGCDLNDAPEDCTVEEYTFTDPYLIGWEDKPLSLGKLGDEDFDDIMFLVDGVYPNTPEPATMALLAGGLLGLGGLRRKRG